MNHASLFSGIGGFDLAATWMGWENVFHCEWNEFCQKVLKYHWPNAISYGDITKTDFTIHRGRIDILTGGFPCQPYSLAGKRLGKEDDRHLWPEMLRAIREIAPPWIVGENVSGLINWSGGLVFDEVQSDLEAEGYEVLPVVLPAVAVDAPHRRDRIWFIAYRTGTRSKEREQDNRRKDAEENKAGMDNRFKRHGSIRTTSYSNDTILQGRKINGSTETIRQNRNELIAGYLPSNWQSFPTQSPLRLRNDGIPGKLDGITFPKWRNESIKAFGNAVVPQVPYQIFKAIDQYIKANH